jgi:hypothetical protein
MRVPMLAMSVLLPSLLAAQAPPPGRASASAPGHASAPVARAARRSGVVRIDGRLDEAAWAAAVPITAFFQVDPREGEPVSERTEARILVDDDAIYIGMRLFDREPSLIHRDLARRDDPIDGDLVEVTLDSYHDHLSAYIFRLSPLGARRDAAVSLNGGQDNSWDAVWEGEATVDGEGWSAEYRIPLSQLRYDPRAAEQMWGLQLGRKIARKGEISLFSFVPRTQNAGIHTYGHLAGLGRMESPRRLEVTPYALARTQHPTVAAGDPFRRQNEVVPGVGLDLKYGITSSLTLDATINPDFGQVEVDPAVVNLSAFEVFFPERRPFFIEGASQFAFGDMRTQNSSNGYTFLHSRRIGRSPQRTIGGGDIEYVDAPTETSIAGAVKLTGRTAGGWSGGILDAVTTRERARYRDAVLGDGATTVEPQANYFAGRVKREMRGGNSTVGVAVTAVHRDLGEEALQPLFRRASYVAGFDWNHAFGNRTWAFDGNVVFSRNEGSAAAIDALQLAPARFLQRPDRTTLRRDPTRTSLEGYVAELTLARIAGRHWRGTLTYQEYSPGFDNNELGFLGTTDMRSIAPLVSYQETVPGRVIRNRYHFLFWNPSWNFDGDMTYKGFGTLHNVEFANFWNVSYRLGYNPPVLDDGLTRGGPIAGLAGGGNTNIDISSDRRKRFTYGLFLNYSWNEAGGRGQQVAPRATLRPTSAVRITLQPSLNATHAMAQYVTRVADPLNTETFGSRFVFATLNQRTFSMTTRVDWTFTPALSLQLFAQPLLVAADFTDYKEFDRPREFAFDIYGRDIGTIARDPAGVYTVDPDGPGAAPSFQFGDRDFNSRSLRGSAVLRWEYRPGSALFLVWQQSRSGFVPSGEFDFGRDLDGLFGAAPENIFVVKGTWWLGR